MKTAGGIQMVEWQGGFPAWIQTHIAGLTRRADGLQSLTVEPLEAQTAAQQAGVFANRRGLSHIATALFVHRGPYGPLPTQATVYACWRRHRPRRQVSGSAVESMSPPRCADCSGGCSLAVLPCFRRRPGCLRRTGRSPHPACFVQQATAGISSVAYRQSSTWPCGSHFCTQPGPLFSPRRLQRYYSKCRTIGRVAVEGARGPGGTPSSAIGEATGSRAPRRSGRIAATARGMAGDQARFTAGLGATFPARRAGAHSQQLSGLPAGEVAWCSRMIS